jgi:glycosyltransferase involved in cell wall biosynthesis
VADVTFSVIVATSGRKTLLATLDSIVEQLGPGDEVIVRQSDDGDFGCAARRSMIPRAKGTHLLFIDDDDQYARGAFGKIRAFAREHPGRIGVFRMRYDNGLVIWTEPVVRLANVSTQMLCVPNLPGKLGEWEDDVPYHGDFAFLRSTAELQGEPLFRPEIVAFARTDRRLLRRSLTRIRKLPVRVRYHARRSRLRRLGARLRQRARGRRARRTGGPGARR